MLTNILNPLSSPCLPRLLLNLRSPCRPTEEGVAIVTSRSPTGRIRITRAQDLAAMWWRAVARARRRIAGTRLASTAAGAGAERISRAVVVPRFGGPEVLELRQGVPVPDLKPGEVLVRARAVSINPLDLRVSTPFWLPLWDLMELWGEI
jgi:hypothetical protein